MNNVILSGNAVKDFELVMAGNSGNQFPSARGSIAVNRPVGRPDSNGNWPVDFFFVNATGKTAEKLSEVKKGDKVILSGYFFNYTSDNNNGQRSTMTIFKATHAEVFISRSALKQQTASASNQQANAGTSQRTSTSPQNSNAPQGMPTGQGMPNLGGFTMPDLGEELPFQ